MCIVFTVHHVEYMHFNMEVNKDIYNRSNITFGACTALIFPIVKPVAEAGHIYIDIIIDLGKYTLKINIRMLRLLHYITAVP